MNLCFPGHERQQPNQNLLHPIGRLKENLQTHPAVAMHLKKKTVQSETRNWMSACIFNLNFLVKDWTLNKGQFHNPETIQSRGTPLPLT